jgi:hypothetical protein
MRRSDRTSNAALVSRLAGVLAVALMAGPASVRAQTVTIDEGTFHLRVNGRDAGTETFIIRQTGTGADAQVIARSRVTLETGTDTALVQYGEALRPAAYSIQVGGDPGERVSGRVVGRRVSARIVSSEGENMREYLVSEGAVVIDDAVAHQYYFLARRFREGESRIAVIVPREARQLWLAVEPHPDETVSVGTGALAATRLVLTPEQGDVRTLWIDSDARILRLEIPSRNFVAERAAPPR